MSNCNDSSQSGQTIANRLAALGPRTLEGDQGRASMYGVQDAIAAEEYDRKRRLLNSKSAANSMLRTISGHRLAAPGGRAS